MCYYVWHSPRGLPTFPVINYVTTTTIFLVTELCGTDLHIRVCVCLWEGEINYGFFSQCLAQHSRQTHARFSFSLSYIEDPNYYRGISFLNMGRKLCTFILNNRLSEWTEETNVIEEINPQSHVHTVCTTTTSLTKKKYIYIVYRFSKGIWLCFSI